MKILYIECNMGISGDMLMGALYELCDRKEQFIEKMNSLRPLGVTLEPVDDVKLSVSGTHMRVMINGAEEGEAAAHESTGAEGHRHDHHDHRHYSMGDIVNTINSLDVSEKVKTDAINIYKMIADAESTVHGAAVEQVHLHEVGALDAIADVVGNCLLMEMLGADRVCASPIHLGCGQVRCAHGLMPVPAPATALILRGVPCYGGTVEGELCTPTGAALVKYFVSDFGSMPVMSVSAIGYGMGKKNFSAPNCVRVFSGSSEEDAGAVTVIECNIDDMTAEEISAATEALLKGGALDAYTIPIGMKKCRPGTMLGCICARNDSSRIARLMLENTTTLGVRMYDTQRLTLSRRSYTVKTQYGDVRVKVSYGYGVRRVKPEFDDVKALSEKMGTTHLDAQEYIRAKLLEQGIYDISEDTL